MVSNLSYLTLGGGNLPQGSRGRVGSAGYYWTNTSFGWIDGFMLAEYLTVAPLEDYGNTTIYFRWRPYHELRYSSWDPNFIRCIAR